MKKFGKILALVALIMVAVFVFAACGDDEPVVKDEYDVTYNLNYEGVATKVVSVKANTRATSWRASRKGYTLEGWFTDAECTQAFDFMSYVNSDMTLYASWQKNAVKYTVTLNYNYEGASTNASIKVDEGNTINSILVPTCPRLGMQYEGWYKEADCINAWNMKTDTVQAETVLYAKYKADPSVLRNEDGSLRFEEIKLNVWLGASLGNVKPVWDRIVNEFNYLYNGKIRITLFTGDLDAAGGQDNVAIRIQQTPGANESLNNYYDAGDLLDLAGIEYSVDDWYANEDSIVAGKLHSIPMYASIPYMIYNKALMSKYNGTEPLPTNYSEFITLLTKASEGEKATKPDFSSIYTNTTWTFKEASSMTAFAQNDTPYYFFKDGLYGNDWGEEMTDAKMVFQRLFDLFNPNGLAGGNNGGATEYNDESALSKIANGNALLALVNWYSTFADENDTMGVMPMSGLFADSDKQMLKSIIVHTIGLQFYKADNVGIMQLIAGAVFGDYASGRMLDMATSEGLYPLCKAVVESDAFQKSSISKVKLLLKLGDPDNFHTLPGMRSGKAIFNQTAAETYVVPLLSDYDNSKIDFYTSMLKDSIIGQLGN